MKLKTYDSPNLKLTVEDRNPECYIATRWYKHLHEQTDREVREFETYGGACDCMIDWLIEHLNAIRETI